MGTTYYLANCKTRELFELGKGVWTKWRRDDLTRQPRFSTDAEIRGFLEELTADGWRFSSPDERADYIVKLAGRLARFIGDTDVRELKVLAEEQAWDLRFDEYEHERPDAFRITDSRYSNDWPRYDRERATRDRARSVRFDICCECEKPHDPDVAVERCICGSVEFRRNVLVEGVQYARTSM